MHVHLSLLFILVLRYELLEPICQVLHHLRDDSIDESRGSYVHAERLMDTQRTVGWVLEASCTEDTREKKGLVVDSRF